MTTRTASALPSIQICCKKYRIYSRKEYTATNITIQKITERVEYNIILEVTDNKK